MLDRLDTKGAARSVICRSDAAPTFLRLTEQIKKWAIAHDVSAPAYFASWEVARRASAATETEAAILFFILLELSVHVGKGSTRLNLDDKQIEAVLQELRSLEIEAETCDLAARLLRALTERPSLDGHPWSAVIGRPPCCSPLIVDADSLYPHNLWTYEAAVSRCIRDRLQRPTPNSLLPKEPAAERLTAEQRKAVAMALEHRLALITGGPGTGKTSIVFALIRTLVNAKRVKPNAIALAAPTGKAADRIHQAMQRALTQLKSPTFHDRELALELPVPTTLHRLLHFSAERREFLYHRHHPLPHRWVIVDESSMIDIDMMYRLFDALTPQCHLVLLGDADQLPAVDPGSVFFELCRFPQIAKAVLTRNFRIEASSSSAAALNQLSATLLVTKKSRGFSPNFMQHVDASRLRFVGVEACFDSAQRDSILAQWFDVFAAPILDFEYADFKSTDDALVVPSDTTLEHMWAASEKSQVLCATRQGLLGSEHINRWYLRQVQVRSPKAALSYRGFAHGVRVIVRRNDYALKLFNGDMGTVLRIGQEEKLAVLFRRGHEFVLYPISWLASLIEPAFAITVHKSQGSEYDHVCFLWPDYHSPLISRELIYTAVTRARRSVLLLGQLPVFERGIAERLERDCGLAERIERGA